MPHKLLYISIGLVLQAAQAYGNEESYGIGNASDCSDGGNGAPDSSCSKIGEREPSDKTIPLNVFMQITQGGACPLAADAACTPARSMRALTAEELELIAGTNSYTGSTTPPTGGTTTLPPVTVTDPPPITLPPVTVTPPPTSILPVTGPTSEPPIELPPVTVHPDPPRCYTPLPSADRVDANQIIINEGGLKDSSYDLSGHGHSGITIGGGIDLSQQSVSGLTGWGVPADIMAVIQNYVGAGGVAYQSAHGPVTLTDAQAEQLTTIVYDHILDTARDSFDARSSTQWNQLPADTQTVLADVAIQFGASGAPNFFGEAETGEWDEALDEVQNGFPGVNAARTNERVDLLSHDIDDEAIPETSTGNCP